MIWTQITIIVEPAITLVLQMKPVSIGSVLIPMLSHAILPIVMAAVRAIRVVMALLRMHAEKRGTCL
jgi:hypothetical protein